MNIYVSVSFYNNIKSIVADSCCLHLIFTANNEARLKMST